MISRSIVGIGETKYDYDFTALSGTGQYTRIVTDALGNKTTEVYDKVHRLVSSTSPMGRVTSTSRDVESRMHTTYLAGKVIATEKYDDVGNLIFQTDRAGLKTTYTYDGFGNLTSTTFPDGTTKKLVWGFSGSDFDETGSKMRLQIEVDTYGHETRHGYNGFGQRTKTVDVYGGVTEYKYDTLGNLISKKIPTGAVWIAKYDAAGKVIESTYPDGGGATIEYDARSRPIKITDALGNVTKTAYDGNGNLVARVDALGNIWRWTYNVWDLQDTATSPLGYVTHFQYDKLGRKIAQIDALGNRYETEHDADGGVIANTAPHGLKTGLGYDKDGVATDFIDPFGGVQRSTYDEFGRQVAIVDSVGNRATFDYGYDPLGQLVFETRRGTSGSWDLKYKYDSVGNRIEKSEGGQKTKYVIGSCNELIAQAPSRGAEIRNTYDVAGRQIKSESGGHIAHFEWDAAGRLIATRTRSGDEKTYIYDSNGLRIAGKVNGAERRYIARDNDIVAETDGNGKVLASWTYGLGEDSSLLSEHRAGKTFTFVFDPSSNTRMIVNGNGKTESRLVYDAFGVKRSAIGEPAETPFTFAGRHGYWRTGEDEFYVRARHYSASTGRWFSKDPIGFTGGDWNLFRYVGNNPVNWVDPTGLSKCGCQDTCGAITNPDWKKQYKALLTCISKGETQDDAVDCIKKTVKDIIADEVIEYLACYFGGAGTALSDPLGCDYCEPRTQSFCCDCCYSKYLKSLFTCFSGVESLKGFLGVSYGECNVKAIGEFGNCELDCNGELCPAFRGDAGHKG